MSDAELFFTPEQIEDLELICEDPAFLDGAIHPYFVALPMNHPEPEKLRNELRQFENALGRLSTAARAAIWSADPARNLRDNGTIPVWRAIVQGAITEVEGGRRSRQRLKVGEFSRELFEAFALPLTPAPGGDFVLFLKVIKQATKARWNPHELARDTLAKAAEK